MKSKKATFFLGLVVMAVWSAIFIKIFHSVNENNSSRFSDSDNSAKVPYNDYSVVDTSHLLLNYRDPFGISAPTILQVLEVPNSLNRNIPALNRVEVRPAIQYSIQYSGYVKNAGSGRLIAMLNINGKDVMMREGETVEKVKLLKNLRDSVAIIYNGKVEIIPISAF